MRTEQDIVHATLDHVQKEDGEWLEIGASVFPPSGNAVRQHVICLSSSSFMSDV